MTDAIGSEFTLQICLRTATDEFNDQDRARSALGGWVRAGTYLGSSQITTLLEHTSVLQISTTGKTRKRARVSAPTRQIWQNDEIGKRFRGKQETRTLAGDS